MLGGLGTYVSLNRRRVDPFTRGTFGRYASPLELQLHQIDFYLVGNLLSAAAAIRRSNGCRVGTIAGIDLGLEGLEPRVYPFTQLAHHRFHNVIVGGAGRWNEHLWGEWHTVE